MSRLPLLARAGDCPAYPVVARLAVRIMRWIGVQLTGFLPADRD